MFVEFEEFVVAVDAPVGYPLLNELPASDVAPGPTADWLSRRYLELIREAVPDKPVRYLVLSHFHNDHAGGLRAFVADLLNPVPLERFPSPSHERIDRFFAEWLGARGLEVDVVLASHGTGRAGQEHLDKLRSLFGS